MSVSEYIPSTEFYSAVNHEEWERLSQLIDEHPRSFLKHFEYFGEIAMFKHVIHCNAPEHVLLRIIHVAHELKWRQDPIYVHMTIEKGFIHHVLLLLECGFAHKRERVMYCLLKYGTVNDIQRMERILHITDWDNERSILCTVIRGHFSCVLPYLLRKCAHYALCWQTDTKDPEMIQCMLRRRDQTIIAWCLLVSEKQTEKGVSIGSIPNELFRVLWTYLY
jgi:hypothetical protein